MIESSSRNPAKGGGMETMKPFLAFILAAMPLACGSAESSEKYPVNERILRETPGGLVLEGGGCMAYWAGQPAGTSTGNANSSPDLTVQQKFDGTHLLVLASSGGDVLFQKQYDLPFLLSQQTDISSVSTANGNSYQLRYWGSTACYSVDPNETYGDTEAAGVN
jgi:hypothetical protein